MTEVPADVDPYVAERVIEIRNRFGIAGLRQAQRLIDVEIRIFEEAAAQLASETEPVS